MAFIPGLQLAQLLYDEIVKALLDQYFPQLPYTAALIGSGSEVLGFDDEMSTDHHWGPRLQLFLSEEDHQREAANIDKMLAFQLPYEFHGYATNFSAPDPDDNGTQLLAPIQSGAINHRLEIATWAGFLEAHLGYDSHTPLQITDWLTFPEQRLRTLTAGAIFADGLALESKRASFHYYPHEVWLYLLAADWNRIGQEEHLMGRAGLVGDEIGSALIAARLVRALMHLCFLMARTYAPYPKWFGMAFKQLPAATALTPIFTSILNATSWPEREAHLMVAYEQVAQLFNELGITEPLPTKTKSFFGRPFQVIAQHGFAAAVLAKIQDPTVKAIAAQPLLGNLDQISDSTDLLSNPSYRPVLKQLYD